MSSTGKPTRSESSAAEAASAMSGTASMSGESDEWPGNSLGSARTPASKTTRHAATESVRPERTDASECARASRLIPNGAWPVDISSKPYSSLRNYLSLIRP